MQQLPFETTTQFVALALTLFAGWLLGLASARGGKRWRERYQDETLAHASYRDQAKGELRESQQRVRDLEAEVARLRQGGAVDGMPAERRRGWFGWGRDNLSRIRGIDNAREGRLNELGIKTYAEIENMTAEEEAVLEQKLGVSAGSIAKEGWREQAALLRAGNDDEHATRYA